MNKYFKLLTLQKGNILQFLLQYIVSSENCIVNQIEFGINKSTHVSINY